MEAITQIGRCLTTPYFFTAAIIIVLSLSKRFRINKLIVFIFVFSVIWRLFFKISSSRYCCNFLILLFICFGITLQKIGKKKCSSLGTNLILCFFLTYNIIHSLYSSQNAYILDCNEYLKSKMIERGSVFLIDSKEYNRIKESIRNTHKRFDLSSCTDFESIIGKYNFWEHDGYYVLYEKKEANSQIDSRQKKVCSFSSKKKNLNIYKIKKFSPSISITNDTIKSLIQEDIEKGNIVPDLVQEIIYNGVLKSLNIESNIYVYLYKGKTYWFADSRLPRDTEIVFHLYSDNTKMLPPERAKYGYDNLGFHIRKEKPVCKYKEYNLFCRKIPNSYSIACIKVGTEHCGVVTWFYPFKP